MNKKMTISLATLALSIPLIFTQSFACNKTPAMKKLPFCPKGEKQAETHMNLMKSTPQYMKDIAPIQKANGFLQRAIESGNVAEIQKNAGLVLKAIETNENKEIKESLVVPSRFLALITKTNSYRNIRIAYFMVLKNFYPMYISPVPKVPYLLVDSETYKAIDSLKFSLHQINLAFNTASIPEVDMQLDKVLITLKSIKNPALNGYLAPAIKEITAIRTTKDLLNKLQQYRRYGERSVQRVFIYTAEKK